MPKAAILSTITLPGNFTDVVYLTGRQMPPEIKKLLRQRKLSWSIHPINAFPRIRQRLDLIGTVIIDTEELGLSEQQKLARIIQTLEMENIGVILLGNRNEVPVKSFSLAPVKASFSLAGTMESISIDELWTRISVNLAYRKKSPGITVKPANPPKPVQKIYRNKLAEQLSMTSAMVDNLAEQLRLAGLVQQDFLPAKLPNLETVRWATVFLPAEWVSGDIYDIARIDEEYIGFYVADVVGHGMPAALLTIFLKQALVMRQNTESSYHIFSPAEAMVNLNARMAGQKLSGYQFATCCYCILNVRTLKLTYARAGHPYPVLIRAGQQPQPLETQGTLLGIFGQAEYVEETIQLEPADKLLIYSDGAEAILGAADSQSGSGFSREFYELKDQSIIDMTDKLNMLAQTRQTDPSEVDDITIVGLEIL